MKTLPVYQNLDTSFVNLSALIRHLRERNFHGRLQISLSGYEAEMTFGTDKKLDVLEHDLVAGRIAEGDEALQRILIRARAGGGKIGVFEFTENAEPVSPEPEKFFETPLEKPIAKPFSEQELTAFAPARNGDGKTPVKKIPVKEIFVKKNPDDFLNLKPENNAPLPFEFTNRVENLARRNKISAEERQQLLRLVGELFAAVEDVFQAANLDFTRMLAQARAEVSDDYPFLNPISGAFFYKQGVAEMSVSVNAKLFAASINEVLLLVLKRIADEPNHLTVYRDAVQKILALVHRNQSAYDNFSITPQLTRNLGV